MYLSNIYYITRGCARLYYTYTALYVGNNRRFSVTYPTTQCFLISARKCMYVCVCLAVINEHFKRSRSSSILGDCCCSSVVHRFTKTCNWRSFFFAEHTERKGKRNVSPSRIIVFFNKYNSVIRWSLTDRKMLIYLLFFYNWIIYAERERRGESNKRHAYPTLTLPPSVCRT